MVLGVGVDAIRNMRMWRGREEAAYHNGLKRWEVGLRHKNHLEQPFLDPVMTHEKTIFPSGFHKGS